MQSISAPGIHIVPVQNQTVDLKKSDDSNEDVLHIEKLLNKIFGDELERALALEGESNDSSNLIEFPLMHELVSLEHEAENKNNTLDFSPEAFDLNDPVLETDLTRFTPSIIERDDFDYGQLQAVVDAQQEQLAILRADLKHKDALIARQLIDLASKDDQLKYVPELFNKALQTANVEAANALLVKDLVVEKLLNEELNGELSKVKTDLAAVNNHTLVKFARILGVMS